MLACQVKNEVCGKNDLGSLTQLFNGVVLFTTPSGGTIEELEDCCDSRSKQEAKNRVGHAEVTHRTERDENEVRH